MKVFLCLVACLAVANAAAISPFQQLADFMRDQAKNNESDAITANVNDELDAVMDNIGEFFASVGLDPLELPDLKDGFKFDVGFIEFHGELELTKGQAHDLSSVNRAGDALLHYDKKMLRVQMGLGFDSIKLNFDYLARIMNIGPKGQILASVKRTELFFDVILDLEDFTIYLQNFNVKKIGEIKVNFKGNALTDWLVNPMLGVVTGIFKGLITGVISAAIEGVIKDVIAEINNPPTPPQPIMLKFY